ncbi:MAG: response regulator transcription factor [Ferruginibacter sp.]|nr:response regulator transcription factor [Ferruginibacter sp.]
MSVEAKKYNCIIVDDNEIDKLTTLSFCKQVSFLKHPITFTNGEDAIAYGEKYSIDIAFLDIDMPTINGLDLKKRLQNIQACVFVTSHPEFALESYELNVFDYIVKPINQQRFLQCINRLQEYLELKHKAYLLDYTLGTDAVFIKEGHQQYKLPLHEIMYLEALKDYTGIVTEAKKYCVLSPISSLLQESAFKNFIRIHRSYAVQKHFIKQYNSKEVFIKNISLPIGRSYKNEIMLLN